MKLHLVPQAYAQNASTDCDAGSGTVNLVDCAGLRTDQVFRNVEAYRTPAGLVNLIVNNLFVIGGVVLFIMIIIAGIKLVQGTKTSVADASSILKNAFIGFILMICAYWIVQIIGFLTGANIPLA